MNLRQALYDVLKSSSSLTSLLADGQNSILLAGRVSPSTPMPCVAIRDAGRSGGPRRLPFFDAVYYLYVYDDCPAAQAVSYTQIDAILDQLKQTVNGATLSVDGQETVFTCFLDNFDSPDMWDETLEKPYKMVRIRIPGVYFYDYRS